MKHRHLAVFTHLGNGHVFPALPLCAELVKGGYRVTYTTNRHYADAIAEVGAEPVPFRNKPWPELLNDEIKAAQSLPLDDPRLKQPMESLQAHFFEETTELLSQVDAFYQKNIPDLILYDRYHIPGRILAKRFDIPAVQMSAHFAHYNNQALYINGVCENPGFIVEWSTALDKFLSAYGITTPGSYWHVENLNIHLLPKQFQHHSSWFDERFCFAGALLNRPFRRLCPVPVFSRVR